MTINMDTRREAEITKKIQFLAKQVALNLREYYAVPDKYRSDDAFQQLHQHIEKHFLEIAKDIPKVNFNQFNKTFVAAANKFLHTIDAHLEIGIPSDSEWFLRLLAAEEGKLIFNTSNETAYFPCMLSKPPALTREEQDEQNKKLLETNCGFGTTPPESIPDSVGYIKLDIFHSPTSVDSEGRMTSLVEKKADEVFRSVENKEALIIDLRGCPGGSPELVRQIASYFFEPGTPINKYVRSIDQDTEEFKTTPQVLRLQMPIFILVDNESFSAAESFSYAMQQFAKHNVQNAGDQITLIGEKTCGGAHRWGQFPIIENDTVADVQQVSNDWFVMVPMVNNVNAWSGTNWEDAGDCGVVPDVPAKSQNALRVAVDLHTKNHSPLIEKTSSTQSGGSEAASEDPCPPRQKNS